MHADANSERGKINTALQQTLCEETHHWGIEIVRAELKEIDPPQDVQETMNKVVKAENEKVAAVDFATATETNSDGARRAEIKRAEGIKQAKVLEAEGEAIAGCSTTCAPTRVVHGISGRRLRAPNAALGVSRAAPPRTISGPQVEASSDRRRG